MSKQDVAHGRRVLITAGAGGLGWVMAQTFLSEGYQVFISDVDADSLVRAKAAHPVIHTAIGDVSDEQDVASLFRQVSAELGGLDVLINNAGIAGPTGNVETITRQDWDRTMAINVTGQFLCAREAIPLLKASKRGVMINLSSAAGHLGFAGRAAYSASKWAVVGLTKTLAIELGQYGISVNSILPGAVDGERIRAVIANKARVLGKPVDEIARMHEQQSSLGRLIEASDVANMALFLASDAARNISGQALAVDGHTQALI